METESFRPIIVNSISTEMEDSLSFDLYIKSGSGYALYKPKNYTLKLADKVRLERTDTTHLYIKSDALPEYNAHLSTRISSIIQDESLRSDVRGELLYQASSGYVEEVFNTVNMDLKTASRYRYLSETLITTWMSDPNAVRAMVTLHTHSDYEYAHSVQVSALALILGDLTFPLMRSELSDLVLGSLLHDLGKVSISKDILNKEGKLSDSERTVIRLHPGYAHSFLKVTGAFDDLVLSMVLDHHEFLDGSGYPRGLKGAEIGRSARLLAVADIFCALISDRVYRKAYTQEQAIDIMYTEFSEKLDGRILDSLYAYIRGTIPKKIF